MALYKLLILSPCFYKNAEPANLMVKSAQRMGLPVHLFGIGQDFIPHGAHAQILHLYLTMKEGKLADYVVMTDCRDVLFVSDKEEMISKFESFGKDLVMSTEQGCWPPEPEIVEFFHGKDPHGYDYINAGQYMGRWDYVMHCLEHLLVLYRGKHPGADNSQGWWMWAKMRNELDFAMDSQCKIFQSMSGGVDGQIVVKDGSPYNTVTGTHPCSLHYNGCPGEDEPHGEMFRRLFQ